MGEKATHISPNAVVDNSTPAFKRTGRKGEKISYSEKKLAINSLPFFSSRSTYCALGTVQNGDLIHVLWPLRHQTVPLISTSSPGAARRFSTPQS